ncbi:MAG: 16S rRNA (guanine(527)-N(7))-methyltransferase RsmG [Saprospiraceae bacterium]
MELIDRYFPALTTEQRGRFAELPALYADWNAKINVISRQDIENLEERHVLHSLAIAKEFDFKPGARLLDLGTGGGFPGIPLAILFPEVHFVLADSIGKKIKVVQEVATALGLTNVEGRPARAEELRPLASFDFVLTRGVAPLTQLLQWSQHLLKKKHTHAYPNGLIALKGGNLDKEIADLPGRGKEYSEVFPLRDVFQEPFFDEKFIVYVQG